MNLDKTTDTVLLNPIFWALNEFILSLDCFFIFFVSMFMSILSYNRQVKDLFQRNKNPKQKKTGGLSSPLKAMKVSITASPKNLKQSRWEAIVHPLCVLTEQRLLIKLLPSEAARGRRLPVSKWKLAYEAGMSSTSSPAHCSVADSFRS